MSLPECSTGRYNKPRWISAGLERILLDWRCEWRLGHIHPEGSEKYELVACRRFPWRRFQMGVFCRWKYVIIEKNATNTFLEEAHLKDSQSVAKKAKVETFGVKESQARRGSSEGEFRVRKERKRIGSGLWLSTSQNSITGNNIYPLWSNICCCVSI